ncbi:long-chain fatty acid transport protein 4 isoform X2 [Lepeophtheirus salmonis]
MLPQSLREPFIKFESRNIQLSFLFVGLFLLPNIWMRIVLFLSVWLLTGGIYQVYLISKTYKRDFMLIYKLLGLSFCLFKLIIFKTTIVDILRKYVLKHPQKVMLVNGQNKEEEWTFEMIDQESSRVANYFSNNVGLKKGDCVALYMTNRPEFIYITLGLAKIGVIAALVNSHLRQDSMVYALKAGNAKALIYGIELQDAVDEMEKSLLDLSPNFTLYCSKSGVSPEDITRKRSPVSKDFDEIVSKSPANRGASQNISLSPSSVIFYIYTSGTTGLPKPVKITHMRQMVILMAIKNLLDLNSEDTSYCYLPLYHASGIQLGIGNAFANGGKVVIKKKFSARNFWKDCVKYKVTATQYIGEICRFLLATKPIPEETQHSIRIIYGNGLRPEIWRSFVERFKIPLVGEFYGSTEGNMNLINFDNTVGAVGCIPNIIPKFLIELITPIHLIKVNPQTLEVYRDENGLCVQCDVGEIGEGIGRIVKGHPVKEFNGYANEEENGNKILRDVLKKGDIFFRSGDLLVQDELGYLYFKDRVGDTFRWKGENVSTYEVEMTANSLLDNQTEVAVYGVKVSGMDGRAGMIALPSKDEDVKKLLDKLFDGFKSKLPLYARPVFVRLLHSEMALTATYKIKKFSLKTEGYDINLLKDDSFYYATKNGYLPLTQNVYDELSFGKIQL